MKKIFLISIILLFAGLGCRGLSTEQQASIRPITLDYWTVFNNVGALQALANDYKRERPYVTVNIRQVRYDEFDNLLVNALADEVEPDIVSMHTQWLRGYQNRLSKMPDKVNVARVTTKGKYQPETIVTPETLNLPSENYIRRNYISTVAEDVIIGGDVYGLPLAADTLALYYNKDLLDKAGIALPPETWTEFVEAVKKSTRFSRDGSIVQSGVAMGTGKNIDNAADILAMLMMQNGISVTTGQRVDFASGLDRANENHPTIQAMRFYTDFARPTKDVYTWNEKMGNALEEFARGKTVFYIGFAYDKPRIQARGPQLKLEVVPIPQLAPGAPANIANYWVESVVKKSKFQDEAWDFIRYVSQPENVKRYTDSTGQPSPLRAQVAEQQGDPAMEAFASQILTAQNWYRGRDIDAAHAAFDDLLTGYLQPYGEREKPASRDANLLLHAARVIGQTM